MRSSSAARSSAVPWSRRKPSMLDVRDTLAIHELLALYGHIIDERQWARADELFTPRTVYDMREFGLGVVQGTAAIRELWSRPNAAHPLAHHATNILVSVDPDGT